MVGTCHLLWERRRLKWINTNNYSVLDSAVDVENKEIARIIKGFRDIDSLISPEGTPVEESRHPDFVSICK